MFDVTCNKLGRNSVKCVDDQEQSIRSGARVKRAEPILSYYLDIYIEELEKNKKYRCQNSKCTDRPSKPGPPERKPKGLPFDPNCSVPLIKLRVFQRNHLSRTAQKDANIEILRVLQNEFEPKAPCV